MATETTELVLKIKTTDTGVSATIDKINGKLKTTGKTAQNTTLKLQTLSKNTKQLGQSFSSFGNKVGLAFGALTAAITANVVPFSRFESGLANVKTLLSGTDEEIEKLSKDLDELAKKTLAESRFSIQDTSKALFDMVSAGVSAERQTKFLNASVKLAKGGVTDLTTAVNGIVAVQNAYIESNLDATDVSNAFFTAQKFGVTTVGQLASKIGTILPIAKQASFGFDEMLAATAQLTKGGIDTDISITALRGALVGLIKPTDTAKKKLEELGIPFGEAGLKGKSFGEVLGLIAKVAKSGDAELSALFGNVRALTAIAALGTQELENYDMILNAIRTDTVSLNKAVQTQEATFRESFGKFRNQVTLLAVEFGEKLAPSILEITEKLKPLIQRIRDIDPKKMEEFAKTTIKLTIALGGLFILAKITAMTLTLTAGVSNLLIVLPKLVVFLGPGGLLIAGLTILATLFIKNTQNINKFRESLGLLNTIQKTTFTEQQLRSKEFEKQQLKELDLLEKKLVSLEKQREEVRAGNFARKRQLDEEIRLARKELLTRVESTSQFYEQKDILRAEDLQKEKETADQRVAIVEDTAEQIKKFTSEEFEKRKLELGIFRDATISMSFEGLQAQKEHLNELLEDQRLTGEQRKTIIKEIANTELKLIEKTRQAYINLRNTFTQEVAKGIVDGNLDIAKSFDNLGKTIQKQLIEAALNNLINKLVDVIFNFEKAAKAGSVLGGLGIGGFGGGGRGGGGGLGTIIGGAIGGPVGAVLGSLLPFKEGGVLGRPKLQKFQSSGILAGNQFSGDKNMFMGDSGEMIINRRDQSSLFSFIKNTNKTGPGRNGEVINDNKTVNVVIHGGEKTGEQIFNEISPYLEPVLTKDVVKLKRGNVRSLL